RDLLASVNFDESMVVAVSAGRLRGRGHSIQVAAVERRERPAPDAGHELVVTVRAVSPGQDSIKGAGVTAPYHVVRLRASDEPVRFEVVQAEGDPAAGDERTAAAMDAEAWEIGPVIKGKNYSLNMPLRPTQDDDGTWYLEFGPESG